MWRKLEGPPRLLGLVGPSGAGKTSFLRAGLFPNTPSSWVVMRCTPGTSPFVTLGQTLAPAVGGDADAMRMLPRVQEIDTAVELVRRWSRSASSAVLIIDQFEELFTLNAEEVQARFAGFLSRLPLEADVHVLLSMRDDFLMLCNRHEQLRPVVHGLTLLDPPTGANLRRALVQPATKCGYRFEDNELVDEMLSDVEGERGALPLLAFATARLWERRDRDTGLLTRQAYQDIGGVGGALAQHAEATIDRIGVERIPIVRELFRNLITAEGTRAVREWNELLSIFDGGNNREGINPSPTMLSAPEKGVGAGFIPARANAEEVLRELIDARLLTSYEIHEDEHEPTRRVEIIHESLLANWPRLVRWQTQDADGVQLRDQLRQAAKTWDEHDRSDDLLWTGSAFREYSVWRERYPGGLTEIEEAFAVAMTSFANRRRRRRRIATTAALVLAVVIATVFGALWRRSVLQTRRAEASKLLTLGHSALAIERTQALAYAIASLELADTPEARRLALKALWAGPPATVMPEADKAWGLSFSPGGKQLAVGYWGGLIRVFDEDGGAPLQVQGLEDRGIVDHGSFSPDARFFTARASTDGPEVRIWETTTWEIEHVLQVPDVHVAGGMFDPQGNGILTVGFHLDGPRLAPSERYGTWLVHRWTMDGTLSKFMGSAQGTQVPVPFPDLVRNVWLVGTRDLLRLHRLESLGKEPGRIIARYPAVFALNSTVAIDPIKDRIAASDVTGNLWIWPLDGDGTRPERALAAPGGPMSTAFSPDGSRLAYAGGSHGVRLWDLSGPVAVEPVHFEVEGPQLNRVAFSPDGRWLITSGGAYQLAMWPLSGRFGRILHGHGGGIAYIEFTPDGSHLVTQGAGDGKVLTWDLSGGAGLEPTVLFENTRQWGWGLAMDPKGRFVIIGDQAGTYLVPLDGGAPETLEGFPRLNPIVCPEGRLVATNIWREGHTPTMVVMDLETRERREFDPPGDGPVDSYSFDPQGRLLMTRGGVLSRWTSSTDSTEVLLNEGASGGAFALADGRRLAVSDGVTRRIYDLEDGSQTPLAQAHQSPSAILKNPPDSVFVTGYGDGEIRVGGLFDENPHLLLGHEGQITDIWISPDQRWIASLASDDGFRLWPMPDLSKPPLHTLPHDELLAKLKALTNLRAVPDAENYTGYKIEPDFTAYRGWAEVPEW